MPSVIERVDVAAVFGDHVRSKLVVSAGLLLVVVGGIVGLGVVGVVVGVGG